MFCPKCNSKMTCLFISFVCDTCEPPNSSSGPKIAKHNEERFFYGYCVFSDVYERDEAEFYNLILTKCVFASETEAKASDVYGLTYKNNVRTQRDEPIIEKVKLRWPFVSGNQYDFISTKYFDRNKATDFSNQPLVCLCNKPAEYWVMDPNAILGRFLRHVEAFRQSGDTDDAAQAAECHTYLSEWLQVWIHTGKVW